MASATEQTDVRPGENRLKYVEQAGERGRRAGATWAENSAEYLELKRLAEIAMRRGFEGEQAGYRVLNLILGERHLSRKDVAAFLATYGLEHDEADAQSPEYWRGFAQSALEAFEAVKI